MSNPLHIDCVSCPVRDLQCDDCMVTALLDMAPPAHVDLAPPALRLDHREQQAIDLLHGIGLISHEVATTASARRESLRHLRVTG